MGLFDQPPTKNPPPPRSPFGNALGTIDDPDREVSRGEHSHPGVDFKKKIYEGRVPKLKESGGDRGRLVARVVGPGGKT